MNAGENYAENEGGEMLKDSGEEYELELEYFTPPSFNVDIPDELERMCKYLDEKGYAVISNALGNINPERIIDMVWDFMEKFPTKEHNDLDRNKIETWDNFWLPNPANGILNGVGYGQSDAQWAIRTAPRVKKAFAAIWQTDDLIVSYDGGNAFRPHDYNPSWKTKGGWWHVDQNASRPERSGKVCVQGLVTLTDATPHTGGFCVIPGSHLQHEALCQRVEHVEYMGDFVRVPAGDPLLLQPKYLIGAKAGDLILWDSRTVHCNSPSILPPLPQDYTKPKLLRVVGYVCMTPTAWASQEVLLARRDGYINLTSTSHWPHAFQQAGYVLPAMKQRSLEEASPEVLQLIGVPAIKSNWCIIS